MPRVVRRWASSWFGSAMTVEDRLFRWLAVLRVIVLQFGPAQRPSDTPPQERDTIILLDGDE